MFGDYIYTYILDGHTPVAEPSFLRWSEWYETADCQVALSIQGDVMISTVFLGLNHNFFGRGPPIVFETMVFIGHEGVSQERYATWAQAEEGHRNLVAQVFKPTPILNLPK